MVLEYRSCTKCNNTWPLRRPGPNHETKGGEGPESGLGRGELAPEVHLIRGIRVGEPLKPRTMVNGRHVLRHTHSTTNVLQTPFGGMRSREPPSVSSIPQGVEAEFVVSECTREVSVPHHPIEPGFP